MWCHHTNGALGLIAVNITTVLFNIFRFGRANEDKVSAVKPLNKTDRNLQHFNFFRPKMLRFYCVVAEIFWQKNRLYFLWKQPLFAANALLFQALMVARLISIQALIKARALIVMNCLMHSVVRIKFRRELPRSPEPINQNSVTKRSYSFLEATRTYKEI